MRKEDRFYMDERLRKRGDMTYILGARCKDGVVMVGDRRVTTDGGYSYSYHNKIFIDMHPGIIGSSGVMGLFDKFRRLVRTFGIENNGKSIPWNDLVAVLEGYVLELNKTYAPRIRGLDFDVLFGFRTSDAGAVLTYITPYGLAEPVETHRVIGHGEPYGSIILRSEWKPEMNMEEVAELGYFIIKCIEKYEVDGSVGVGEGKPQIWFIPDKGEPHEAGEEVMGRLRESVTRRLRDLTEHPLFGGATRLD